MSKTTQPTDEIRIYVACLAAYNNGHLHGVWIDATQDLDDIQAQVSAMLAASPIPAAEEYAIHDFEGFGDYALSEHTGLEAAHQAACFIDAYPDYGAALLAHVGDVEEAARIAEENYCGCYGSLADYAEELTEQSGKVPEHLAPYIDYERMARDMELGGDVFTLEVSFREVHVFWSR